MQTQVNPKEGSTMQRLFSRWPYARRFVSVVTVAVLLGAVGVFVGASGREDVSAALWNMNDPLCRELNEQVRELTKASLQTVEKAKAELKALQDQLANSFEMPKPTLSQDLAPAIVSNLTVSENTESISAPLAAVKQTAPPSVPTVEGEASSFAFMGMVALSSGIISQAGTAPSILSVDFPRQIQADGNPQVGHIFFKDPDGDVNKVKFEVVEGKPEALKIEPGMEFDPNVREKTAGAIEFKLAATAPQRARLRVTLLDAGNRASPPAEFTFIALAAGGRPGADYGEAPDELPTGYAGPFADVIGHFPTLYKTANSRVVGTPGAHALEVPLEKAELLGVRLSWETDANDPDDPDETPNLVFDDFSDGLRLIPWPPALAFTVKLGPQASPGPRYVNVLIDLDRNGTWDPLGAIVEANSGGVKVARILPKTPAEGKLQIGDVITHIGGQPTATPETFAAALKPGTTLTLKVQRSGQTLDVSVTLSKDEWAIKNLAVEVTPGQSREVTMPFPAALLEALGGVPSPAWMRVALTPTPMDAAAPWDGSGQFASGEIEDYPIVGVKRAELVSSIAQAAAQAAAQAREAAQAADQANALAVAAATAATKAEAEARARQEAFALAYSQAFARASAAEKAAAVAVDWEAKIKYQSEQARAIAYQARQGAIPVPCGTVVYNVQAFADAASAAAAEAAAMAVAISGAAAEAKATAQAMAAALAAAKSEAEAHAKAVAEAKATALAAAQASAQAVATASSEARSAAAAAAEVTALMQDVGIALAVGTQLQQAAAVLVQTALEAQAQAVAAAYATAAAAAQAQAQALAAAVARAKAEATVNVMASAAAFAATIAAASAKAQASAEAVAFAAAKAYANAEAVARATAYVKASVEAIIDPNCKQQMCPTPPPPPPTATVRLMVEAWWWDGETWNPLNISITTNGTAYNTPFSVTFNKGSNVRLNAPPTHTITIITFPFSIQIIVIKFVMWRCSGSGPRESKNPNIEFTIQVDTSCEAKYSV